MTNLKVAVETLSGCGGCETAFMDLYEELLSKNCEIVYAPMLMDKKNLDTYVDVTLLSGCVRTNEDLENIRWMRKTSKTLVGFGSCASLGGIPGLANLYALEELLQTVYSQSRSSSKKTAVLPSEELPALEEIVRPFKHVIDADYFVPGCPPPTNLTKEFLNALLSGGRPQLPKTIVCDECELRRSGRKIDGILRWGEGEVAQGECLLEQGFVCLGLTTRAGCKAECLKASSPCRGCMGPPENVQDQGAKMISALASIAKIEGEHPAQPEKLVETFKDIAGTVYRFSLPSSIIQKKIIEG